MQLPQVLENILTATPRSRHDGKVNVAVRARLLELAERAKRKRARARDKAIQTLGGRCACCGHVYPSHLEFHHVNSTGHVDRKTFGISQARLLTLISEGNYRGNIELLCRNCHHCVSTEGTCKCKKS